MKRWSLPLAFGGTLLFAFCLAFFGAAGSAAAAPAPQAAQQYVIELEIIESAWIQATVDGGRPFYEFPSAGKRLTFTGTKVALIIGNAGGVQITVNGEDRGLVGTGDEVVRLLWPQPGAVAVPDAAPATGSDETAGSDEAAASDETAGSDEAAEEVERRVYVVQPGDTLGGIAAAYEVELADLQRANGIQNPSIIRVGLPLVLPEPGEVVNGRLPLPTSALPAAEADEGVAIVPRGTITERLTPMAREADPNSAYANQTLLTYYGRPNVPIMGILGEFDIDTLTEVLEKEAAAYDEANGPALGVKPVYHLVHGMATKAVGDGSHLIFLNDERVMTYISKALELDYEVILDVQIGALSPARSISSVLPYLHYPNVHLAIDPEFAMVYAGQAWPGLPIGYVTAEQVNETQAVMQRYMEENDIDGPRILLVHQFQDSMIVGKDRIDYDSYDRVDLTLSVDGWGPPAGKVSKYNALTEYANGFTAFKLFYRWDEPLMTPAQAMGEDQHPSTTFMEITPNLIIYQ